MGKITAAFLPAVLVCNWLVTGCATTRREAGDGPVLFPAPPAEPRVQFLKSFSNAEDLGVKTAGAFEKFVLGDPELRDFISKPFGLAIAGGKLYVCDFNRRMVEVLDIRNKKFSYLTEDRRLVKPLNIWIDEDGKKYITDPRAGAVFVFDENNRLDAMLGTELKIAPLDIVVRGGYCYITEYSGNQVVVLDKKTGDEVRRIGEEGDNDGQFRLIGNLALDAENNIYVTDKLKAKIFVFDREGAFLKTIGSVGDHIDQFVRPKGIALDRAGRIWVVDAASEVAKIYNQEGELLLFFGLPGNKPGMMNLPVDIVIDYDNVDLFSRYAVEGADLELLVLVSNQYGNNKINVYGFGTFPNTSK